MRTLVFLEIYLFLQIEYSWIKAPFILAYTKYKWPFSEYLLITLLESCQVICLFNVIVSRFDRPSGRRLLAKLVPTFTDRGFHVVSAMDPRDR
jgi:hypothetical protein